MLIVYALGEIIFVAKIRVFAFEWHSNRQSFEPILTKVYLYSSTQHKLHLCYITFHFPLKQWFSSLWQSFSLNISSFQIRGFFFWGGKNNFKINFWIMKRSCITLLSLSSIVFSLKKLKFMIVLIKKMIMIGLYNDSPRINMSLKDF